MSEEQPKLVPSVEKALYERPGFGIWFAAFFLTALVTGSFFMTGLFIVYGVGASSHLLPLILLGVIPGLVCGAVSCGFVYSIYPPYRYYALMMGLFLVMMPLQLGGLLVHPEEVTPSLAPIFIGPIAVLMAGFALPVIVNAYRRAGKGQVKTPKGSWEERF